MVTPALEPSIHDLRSKKEAVDANGHLIRDRFTP
jgi:hypothetical protein